VAVSPDGGTVYAANYANNSVSPVSTRSDTPESIISVGDGPEAIAITPDQPALGISPHRR
jgi:hyaluronoglucosaminidase